MPARVTDIDEYIESQSEPARSRLRELRAAIRDAAPEATEGISYGAPAFKLGSPLVAYGAARGHIGFYVMDPEVIVSHAADLTGYKTSKGSISLPLDNPIPVDLVAKIVRARVAAIEAKRKR